MMIKLILQNISNLKSNKSIAFLVLLYIISLCNINTAFANTGVNPQIPYSGTVVKNDGTVLDGTYRAKFLIYPNASPIVGETALYEEIRNGIQTYSGIVSPSLPINDGKFDILLGSQNTSGISSLNDDSLWLELQLDIDNNGSYEEIFSPRRRIGSALSAINSMRLVANGGESTNNLSLNSSGDLVFTGTSLERMRVLGTGNVGIGTASPSQRLQIAGGNLLLDIAASGVAGQLQLRNPANTFQTNIQAGAQTANITYTLPSTAPTINGQLLSSTTAGVMSWLTLDPTTLWSLSGNDSANAWNGTTGTRLGTTSAQPLVLATTNATAQDIRFFTGANGANERMRILGNGNIGIGTTNPQARLDVNGGIRVGNDTSACTSSNIGTLRYNNGGLQVCRAEGWSYLQCPTGYIRVPGSSLYQTKDFCVAKYEMKAVAINAPTTGLTNPNTGFNTIANNTTATTSANDRAIASVASGYPIANINQTTAIDYCTNQNTVLGASLITNTEWMTIARNIEGQLSNWTTGTAASSAIGTGGLYKGHSDNVPATALEAGPDNNGYIGTGQSEFSIEKRTLTLSNGEIIWDLSGNVWEWTNDTIMGVNKPNNSSGSFWQQWTSISNFGTLSYNLTRPSDSNWNSTQNMGQYNAGGLTGGPFTFARGGFWGNTATTGVFALSLVATPTDSTTSVGFRCVVR